MAKRRFRILVIDLKVNLDLCFNCGACASICPFDLINVMDGKVTVEEGCTDCGLCSDACPVGAIEIDEK